MRLLVFSEDNDLIPEMINAGKSVIGEDIELYVISINQYEKDTGGYGAKKHIKIKNRNILLYPHLISSFIRELHKEHDFDFIFIGSTRVGREVAPRLAQSFKVEYLSDVFSLHFISERVVGKRYIMSGKVISIEEITSKPFIITILPKSFDKIVLNKNDRKLKEMQIDIPASKEIEVVNIEKEEKEGVNIEAAEIIVSVGKGFKRKEDIELAIKLAKILGGELGCSRPIAADLKWLSEERWIGLSGHKVKPKLYIAVGISGQTQHIAGIRDSEVIVAINNDPDAPIFKYADYGIVGDLYKVLPKLIEEIQK